MPRPMRTFVALRVGPECARRMRRHAEQLEALDPALRLVEREDLHLTLHFLGGTPDDDVWKVSKALTAIGRTHPPLELEYVGLGAFPVAERARVVWAGVREVSGTEGRLAALVGAVGEALGDLGYPPERRGHHAHVTLGRLRSRPRGELVAAVEGGGEVELGVEILSEVKLIVSDPSQRPYHYIDLTTVDLEGEEG